MSVNRKNAPARPGAAAALVDDRPLVARSVIASILLPLDPPALPGGRLVRACELFGIAEGTSRVALSRMVAAGELEATDGVYRLTGRLLERQARQQQGRHPVLRPWEGRFVVATVAAERRAAPERAALREALGRLHLAELREGVWLRPDNLVDFPARFAAADPVVGSGHCLWLTAELAELEPTTPAELVARLFDVSGWAARADGLARLLESQLPALEAHDTSALAPGFKAAAAAVRHLTADPLLPAELLATRWPADELRGVYDRYERAYWQVLRDFLRS